jgi:glyoxalase family protein
MNGSLESQTRFSKGIHHITVLAGDARQNADFYVNTLGLRMVKKSVNQDDPGTYHLFYGNQQGSPGSSLTFFPWPGAVRGEPGTGEAVTVSYSVPLDSQAYWADRLKQNGIPCDGSGDQFGHPVLELRDPDGLRLQLVFTEQDDDMELPRTGSVPDEHAIRGFWGVTLRLAAREPTAVLLKELFGFEQVAGEGNRTLYQTDAPIGGSVIIEMTEPRRGKSGRGTIHHVAFRARDEEELDELRRRVQNRGLMPTQIIDRHWFKSVYYREPGGVLFEMATDGPGYAVDEDPEHLGERLILPPWLEPHREDIELRLPKLEV